MKITIDCSNLNDVELEEYLEPNFTTYKIKQNDHAIILNDYTLYELEKAIHFILNR